MAQNVIAKSDLAKNKKARPVDYVSEKEKLQPDWLKAQVDYTITACAQSPKQRRRDTICYNLRDGERDEKEFQYLTHKYGQEAPAKLSHTPLIKPMIDGLVSQEYDQPFTFRIQASDKRSVDIGNQERYQQLIGEIHRRLQMQAKAKMEYAQAMQQAGPNAHQVPPPRDYFAEEEMQRIEMLYGLGWKSSLEIDASDVMLYMKETLRVKQVTNRMFEHLALSGREYFRVTIDRLGALPKLECLHPRQFHGMRNPNSRFIKDWERGFYVEKLSVVDILNRWGHELTKEQRDELADSLPSDYGTILSDMRLMDVDFGDKLTDVTGMLPAHCYKEVYHCEWKSNNEIARLGVGADGQLAEFNEEEAELLESSGKQKLSRRYRKDLYRGTRIGAGTDGIYVGLGKVIHARRNEYNPWDVDLTFNGIWHGDTSDRPFSLMWATKNLQDRYDILHWHEENTLALSGTKVIDINVADIPLWLDPDPMQRTIKWMGYVKQGFRLFDFGQEGQGVGKYPNYGKELDMTLGQGVSIIENMKQAVERAASRITGMSPQALGEVGRYEGKGVTEMAINRSTVVTRPLFITHSMCVQELLKDLLHAAQITFKDGLQASYALGEKTRRNFTINHNNFSLAQLGVHVVDGYLEHQQMEYMRNMAGELIKAQMVDVQAVFDLVTMDSVTEMRETLIRSAQNKIMGKEEQAMQELEKAQKAIAELSAKLQQYNEGEMQRENERVSIEREKFEKEAELKERDLKQKYDFEMADLDIKREGLKLEQLQMNYNKSTMEPKNPD